MRKGFSSSRGAIRGHMGGAPVSRVRTGGFATVAISFVPFLCLGLNSPACCCTALLFVQLNSGVGCELLWRIHKFVAAFLGAKVHRLSAAAALRDGQSLRDIHAADRITHQFSRTRIARYINRLLPVGPTTGPDVHQADLS